MIKRTLMILVLAVFISAPAFGDFIVPESDSVGDDTANVFHGPVDTMVMGHVNYAGVAINDSSDFTDLWAYGWEYYGAEFFAGSAGLPRPDYTCFDFGGYESILTVAGNASTYEWQIVLQVKPKTDLDLTIRDCVLEYAGSTIWGDAGQTGFYRDNAGVLWPIPGANPSITVVALPGPYAHAYPAFDESLAKLAARLGPIGMVMDAKMHPTLEPTSMISKLYTSKGLWEEALVLTLPEDNKVNLAGQPLVPLKQGDMINVEISIPSYSGTNIRYSSDSVEVKYCGYEEQYILRSDLREIY